MAYAAVFAALAIYVFWGTWSMDFAPVMPDCQTIFRPDHITEWFNRWCNSGKFVPGDIIVFIGSPYFWVELKYVIPLGLSGFALALFLRQKGLHSLSSYGAGLLLAFCGYWSTLFSAGHLGWFQWMTYGVFAFVLIEKALNCDKIKYWLLLGATVAWASFYQPDLWLLFTIFTAAYFVYRAIQLKRFPYRGIGIAALSFILIGLPSFRSAFVNDLAGRDKQIESGDTLTPSAKSDAVDRRWIFVTNWSLPPSESLEFLIPRINGDTSCQLTMYFAKHVGKDIKEYTGALGRPYKADKGNYRQHSLYVGFITCAFALLGLIFSWRKCLFFAIAAIIFYLFSLGRYCEPIYRIVYSLPFGDYLRAPVKWHHLTEFCLVVLAAYGIDFLVSLKTKFRFAPFIAAGLILFGVIDLARVDKLYCAPMPNVMARRIGVSCPSTEKPLPDSTSVILGSISILASLAILGYVKHEK